MLDLETTEGAAAHRAYAFEDLHLGMTAAFAKTVSEADIVLFAGVSGDTNPMHLDDEFAARTMFRTRIAHGSLTASFVSTVLGTKLPGPGCIYLRQDFNFRAPVRVGDTVVARVTVKELIPDKRRVLLATECRVRDKVVLDGTALVWMPPPASEA